jgi:hypothetical protein
VANPTCRLLDVLSLIDLEPWRWNEKIARIAQRTDTATLLRDLAFQWRNLARQIEEMEWERWDPR